MVCPGNQVSLYNQCWDPAVANKFQTTAPSVSSNLAPGVSITSTTCPSGQSFLYGKCWPSDVAQTFQGGVSGGAVDSGSAAIPSCQPGQRPLFVGTPAARCFDLTSAQQQDGVG